MAYNFILQIHWQNIYIRTMVVTKGNDKANHYHQKTIGYVNAAAKTEMMEIIKPLLTDEEKAVFRRGKNESLYLQLKISPVTIIISQQVLRH